MNFFDQFKDYMFKGEQQKKFEDMWDKNNECQWRDMWYQRNVAWQICVMQSEMESLKAQIKVLQNPTTPPPPLVEPVVEDVTP